MREDVDIHACSICGSAVSLEGTVTGTKYYVPINNYMLEKIMDDWTMDQFIRDRLRRAEIIIKDLRRQLAVIGPMKNGKE